jgi:hypothetical protein
MYFKSLMFAAGWLAVGKWMEYSGVDANAYYMFAGTIYGIVITDLLREV